MKRILPLFLLFAFLVNSMGYYVIFEINKSVLRSEMRLLIEQGEKHDQIIRIIDNGTNHDLRRIDDHEIVYRGNLYDVIAETVTEGSAVYYCVPDVKEELLLTGFKKICRNKQLVSLDDNLIKIALPRVTSGVHPPFCTKVDFPRHKFSARSMFHPPLNPPPEQSC